MVGRFAIGILALGLAACGEVASDSDAAADSGGTVVDASANNPDGAAPDAEPNAADAAPPDAELPAKIVFVTNGLYIADFGGLDQADVICQTHADAESLGGLYKAWLSDSTGSPSSRFNQHPGPYELVDGTRIADSWADLTDGTVQAAINIAEDGSTFNGNQGCSGNEAWTNTTASGTPRGSTDCTDWTSMSGNSTTGNVPATDGNWTDFCATASCGARLPLYCFEQ